MNKSVPVKKIILLFIIIQFTTSMYLVTGCKEDTTTPITPQRTGKGYYVSVSGDDNNPGTFQQPWRTMQKSANTLQAGDTVYVMAGTYNEQVAPLNSGTAGNYIVYKTYQNENVTLDGTGIVLPNYAVGLFHIEGRSFIKVSGFRIINTGPYHDNSGICLGSSDNIIIEKNHTYNTISSGIASWECTNITIDSNEVELACNDGWQECLTVAVTVNFEVKNNYIHNGGPGTNGGEGICIKDGSSNGKVYKNRITNLPARPGIYVDAQGRNTFNIDVYQNLLYDNGASAIQIASEVGGLLHDIKIYNNVAYHNGVLGLMISDCCISAHPLQNIIIINNTFYRNGSGAWGGGILNDNPQAQNVIIRNNICSQNLSFQIALRDSVLLSNITADHNLIDGFRGYTGEIYGRDSVTGDPQFVNPAVYNLHLLITSPAIDRGSSLNAPVNDFDGISRPQGPGFDIGAYEFKP